jgi:Zn-finger nucleic acid-binding protein
VAAPVIVVVIVVAVAEGVGEARPAVPVVVVVAVAGCRVAALPALLGVDQALELAPVEKDAAAVGALVDAEQGWQRGHPAPSERDDERGRQQSIPNPFKDRDDDDDRRYSEGSRKRRKKSFFDELFD